MIGLIEAPIVTAALGLKLKLLADSFQRLTGHALLPDALEPTPENLWCAPQVIVAHGMEADPIFFYGNRQALELFETDFSAFTQLPSRYSAETMLREERASLLERVSRDGFIDDYAGVRISASGRRFRIEQAVVWNLIDSAGVLQGQAASFNHWKML